MTEHDMGSATTTNLSGTFNNYTSPTFVLDVPGGVESYYDFPNAQKHIDIVMASPELYSAINALALWSVGKGLVTDDLTQVILEHLTGNGADNYITIFKNLMMQKKIYGDSFAEKIYGTDKKGNNVLINLKPLSPKDMRITFNAEGMITGYAQRDHTKNGTWLDLPKEKVLHMTNNRFDNAKNGTSVAEICKWVIEARNEAMTDYRLVLHRNVVPVRIIEIDTDNKTKRDALILEYQDAIRRGEVLVIPKGTVEIKDNTITIQDPTTWIQYLENFFYQVVGVPRVIATSQDYSEAASKVGYMTFEPTYTYEQTVFELDLWNQLGMKLKFNRPPSLGGFLQNSEAKNTGQVGFQPNEMTVSAGRNE